MAVSVEAVLVLVCFYLFVLVTGVVAAVWHRRRHPGDSAMETSLVAGRSLKGVVSVFTMMGQCRASRTPWVFSTCTPSLFSPCTPSLFSTRTPSVFSTRTPSAFSTHTPSLFSTRTLLSQCCLLSVVAPSLSLCPSPLSHSLFLFVCL